MLTPAQIAAYHHDGYSFPHKALTDAELALSGGASPRVSPFPDLRDCAGLLQRAGFSAPVVDVEEIVVRFADPLRLLRDLRRSARKARPANSPTATTGRRARTLASPFRPPTTRPRAPSCSTWG